MRHASVIILAAGLLVTATMAAVQVPTDSAAELIAAVRDDNASVVRTLLASGANANGRDTTGATALMHATAFASPETMRVLLDAGADANASSTAGATALIWAAGDLRKVQLLLERGAMVTPSMKDGTTVLVAAARRGQLDVMRLLLARGSQPTAANERTELLRLAFGERPEIRQILEDAGIAVKSLASAVPPLTAFPVIGNSDLVRELLAMGVSANPRGRFPALASAAFEGQIESVRLLLERGAEANARGQHEVTPLMMAAAATRPDPAIVRLLIDNGANLAARDSAGRTALDWALLHGETEIVRLLRTAGVAAGTPAPPAPSAARKPRNARTAVADALARLQPTGPVFYERAKCVSCHHQTLPLMAMAAAKARGVAVDAEALGHPARAIESIWSGRRENLMAARSRDGGGANELTYGVVALAEAGVPRSVVTDVAVANLLSTQRADGSWVFLDNRPPQADNSRIPFTAMAIRGLDVYAPPGLRQDTASQSQRALAFLRSASPASTQDEAFKLLGLVWSRVPSTEIATQARRLQAIQRDDGGWSQLPTMASDAYGTGQALYALKASGMDSRDRVYQRGVDYLLRTQLDDGTWFARSRAFGFQPYFETGFPHAVDQFISASATAWAIIGLAPAI